MLAPLVRFISARARNTPPRLAATAGLAPAAYLGFHQGPRAGWNGANVGRLGRSVADRHEDAEVRRAVERVAHLGQERRDVGRLQVRLQGRQVLPALVQDV